MLRLLHTADVHLGARHADLGEAAVAQRERQFAAFVRTIDVALAELVDVVLIAGDLFDSNVQPRRSVERVAAELRRLVERRIRTAITPGTHDVYDRASVYRAYDLTSMAAPRDAGMVVVLTPEQPSTFLATCDVSIVGRPFPTKRAPFGPLRDAGMADGLPGRWKVGLFHAAVAIPGRTDGDDVVISTREIAASGLDYVALGHWHAAHTARAGGVTWAYSGAPEPVAVDQDRAGNVLLVTLDEADGRRTVDIEERRVGRTRFERIDLDASVSESACHIERLRPGPTPMSCWTSGSSACGPTSSMCMPMRSRRRCVRRSCGCACGMRRAHHSRTACSPGPTPSPGRSSATSRGGSRSSRPPSDPEPAKRPRSCATRCASVACCWGS